MHAIQITRTGGAEVLAYTELPDPIAGPGQAVVRIDATGVNFLDVYHRTGLYPLPLPFTPGTEGAGVVESVGAGVTAVKPGDRVAWATGRASYAERAAIAADMLVPLPDAVSAEIGAAVMLQGMTAQYLVTRSHALRPGQTALVHAAAGGVGALLVQLAKQRGARVIGTASTPKLELAREAGADVVVDYTRDDFEAVVNAETGGRGVDVAYDSVGATTFDKSLDCVGLRGSLVLFGQSSGVVSPVAPARLAKRGIFFSRPSLFHFTSTRAELLELAGEVLEVVSSGRLQVRVDRRMPLAEAAEAHRVLEGRGTRGKIVLLPR